MHSRLGFIVMPLVTNQCRAVIFMIAQLQVPQLLWFANIMHKYLVETRCWKRHGGWCLSTRILSIILWKWLAKLAASNVSWCKWKVDLVPFLLILLDAQFYHRRPRKNYFVWRSWVENCHGAPSSSSSHSRWNPILLFLGDSSASLQN